MADRLLLTDQQTMDLIAAAAPFIAVAKDIAFEVISDVPQAQAFSGSIASQAALRTLCTEEDDQAQRVLLGFGEGIGMILGGISSAETRAILYQRILAAMAHGMTGAAQIHHTEGNA